MELEELIKKIISYINEGKIVDSRIVNFVNYQNKYAILKPSVTVKVELTKGVVVKIDVTDYFKEELK